MKTNNYLSKFTFLVLAVLLTLAVSADAQRKRTTRKTTPTKTTTTTTTMTTNALEIRQNAEKVSIQLKNVTTFIYKLGGIASAIEALDNDAKANKLSRAQLDKFIQQKQAVITSIRNLKAGLAELETQFRVKPAIKLYLLQAQGVTDLATQSEDLATAGRFTDSGRVLVAIVEKLADTLTAMP